MVPAAFWQLAGPGALLGGSTYTQVGRSSLGSRPILMSTRVSMLQPEEAGGAGCSAGTAASGCTTSAGSSLSVRALFLCSRHSHASPPQPHHTNLRDRFLGQTGRVSTLPWCYPLSYAPSPQLARTSISICCHLGQAWRCTLLAEVSEQARLGSPHWLRSGQ